MAHGASSYFIFCTFICCNRATRWMEAKRYIPVCSEVFPRSGRSVLSDRYTLYCSKRLCKLARMSFTLQSFHFRICCFGLIVPSLFPWHQHLKDVFISSTSLCNALFSCPFTFSDSLSILLSFPLALQIFLWMDCVSFGSFDMLTFLTVQFELICSTIVSTCFSCILMILR